MTGDLNDLMEWAILPREMSLITDEDVRLLLAKGAKNAEALRKQLESMRPSSAMMQMRLR